MEATAIATLVFIFAATALTVLITLCYKGGNGGDRGGNHQKKHHNKTVVTCRNQTNDHDIETGDGAGRCDIAKNIAASEPVAGSAVVYGGGGGEGGGS